MPDTRRHRGPHPEDARLFAPEALPRIRKAADDFSLLLTRGYSGRSALKLVGDRYSLTDRQRTALLRCSASDSSVEERQRRQRPASAARGQRLRIDGYNLLITVESALSGGLILRGRDGCYRDLASLHSTYRVVEETLPALRIIGETIDALAPEEAIWHLDAPVSNSGRLAGVLRDLAAERGWSWQAELSSDPDAVLIASTDLVASTDSRVISACGAWIHLAGEVISRRVDGAWIVSI